VRKAMLFGAIPPYLLKTHDNPEGVDRLPTLIKDVRAVPVEGGPHTIG
jgi:non-heme chloroperoxidase